MTVAFPLHIIATIVLLGGLFFASVVFRPIASGLDIQTVSSLWQQMLSRFFTWGWASLLLILATGIAMVFLKFGGFSGVPMIHRANMVIGVPAIVLFGYVFFAHGGRIAVRSRAMTGPPHRRKSDACGS
jgi:uncharacterized membrane protein